MRQFGLELLDIGTVVREPNTVEHVIDTRQEMRAIADIRPTDVDFLGKCRRLAKDRQIGYCGLRLHSWSCIHIDGTNSLSFGRSYVKFDPANHLERLVHLADIRTAP